MSGSPPVMARKPSATSSVDKASHTSLYECSSPATANRVRVWRGSCWHTDTSRVTSAATCLEVYLLMYATTYLWDFSFYILQDNLIVAVMSVHQCWDSLWERDRGTRNMIWYLNHFLQKTRVISVLFICSHWEWWEVCRVRSGRRSAAGSWASRTREGSPGLSRCCTGCWTEPGASGPSPAHTGSHAGRSDLQGSLCSWGKGKQSSYCLWIMGIYV